VRGLSTAHPIIARSSARPQQETERRLRAADQRPRCAGEGPEKDIYPMLPQTVAEYSPLAAVATAWAYFRSRYSAAVLDDRLYPTGQGFHREWLGHQVHTRRQSARADCDTFSVTGDEEHWQFRAAQPGSVGHLTAIHPPPIDRHR
jgi:hypothetical protein